MLYELVLTCSEIKGCLRHAGDELQPKLLVSLLLHLLLSIFTPSTCITSSRRLLILFPLRWSRLPPQIRRDKTLYVHRISSQIFKSCLCLPNTARQSTNGHEPFTAIMYNVQLRNSPHLTGRMPFRMMSLDGKSGLSPKLSSSRLHHHLHLSSSTPSARITLPQSSCPRVH